MDVSDIVSHSQALHSVYSELEKRIDTCLVRGRIMEQRSKDEIVAELTKRYPGHSPEIHRHIDNAATVALITNVVGDRLTPVISFWLDRPKWRKGVSWEQTGTDGDAALSITNHVCKYPAILQYAYFKTFDKLVCQLCYVLHTSEETTHTAYEQARFNIPVVLETKYEDDAKKIEHSAYSDEILTKMSTII
jgi:hypothetical protein